MTRQYVGARYVPKFFEHDGSTEWLAGYQYEPLTVVTLNGNSFTSKIPVPANVGAPNENSKYWASTGIYNTQVEIYRQEVAQVNEAIITTNQSLLNEINNREEADNNLQSNIDKLKEINKTEIIIFGDSWVDYIHDQENVRIPQTLNSTLGLNVHNYSYGGTGFIVENGYMQQIDNFVNDNSFDHNKIDVCILVAGLNEYNPMTSKETFTTYLQNWVDKIRRYTDAPIYWFFDYSMVNDLRPNGFNRDFYDQQDYFTYISNNIERNIHCENMQGWVQFEENVNNWNTANYYHPNRDGSIQVGYNMSRVIKGLKPIIYQYCTELVTWNNPASRLSRMTIRYYIKGDRLYATIVCPLSASGETTPSTNTFDIIFPRNKPANLESNIKICDGLIIINNGEQVYFYDMDKVYGKIVSGNEVTSDILCVRM